MLSSFLAPLLLVAIPSPQQTEIYLRVPLSSLVEELPGYGWPDDIRLLHWMWPFVQLEGEGEAFASVEGDVQNPQRVTQSGSVHMRVPEGSEVRGRLFLPASDWERMEAHAFVVSPAEFPATRGSFLRAKADHYRRLHGRGLLGDAWFRHRLDAILSELGDADEPETNARPPFNNVRPPETLDTLALFAGGRAVSENLQLDRLLPVPEAEELLVDLDTLEGIAVRAFDWKPLLDPEPATLDALALHVPADQHALFFSSFRAFEAQRAELDRGTAFLAAIDTRGMNLASLVEGYQDQLALPWNAVVRAFAARVVKSIAVTGGDPYFATGTDVAVLLETSEPEALYAFLASLRQAAAPDMQVITGEVAGVPHEGVETPGRGVSSHAAVLEGAVVVSNSSAGLAAVIEASKGVRPRLVDSDDYVFFRQRYPIAAAEGGRDLGLLVIPDAAIRRWCGPRWRIASSRRVRAGAVLADLQARHLDALLEGRQVRMQPERRFPLGSLQLLAHGVASSEYGTLAFQTPIRELELDRVGTLEARNYERWRDGYQSNWSGFFDPIAVELEVRDERLQADVTVLPLIDFSDYDWMRELIGDARLAAGDGDSHPEAVFQLTLALDPESSLVREFEGLATAMLPGVDANPFGWVGDHASLYFDRDEELLDAIQAGETDAEEWNRVPVAVHVDVRNGLQLVTFLTALRAMVEQTAPGVATWHQEQEGEHRFVRISSDELGGDELSIYYATPPGAWIVSLHRETLLRATSRAHRRGQRDAPAPTASSKDGMSVALELTREGLTLMGFLDESDPGRHMRALAWAPLPILDEWMRRYPERDPVELHRRFWAEDPSCPGGGTYRWNAELGSMESSVFGSPIRPGQGIDLPRGLETMRRISFGLLFENDGIRARAELLR